MSKPFSLLFLALVFFSCKKTQNVSNASNPVPYVTVNLSINMDLPQYSSLNTQGGYIYLDNEGARGIVVIHDFSDQFWALDRNCTYNVNDSCAKVTMETSGLSLRCGHYDAKKNWLGCCNSKFNLDGTVLSAPATYPLKRYQVNRNGSLLTITN
jgi:hypothetical protein